MGVAPRPARSWRGLTTRRLNTSGVSPPSWAFTSTNAFSAGSDVFMTKTLTYGPAKISSAPTVARGRDRHFGVFMERHNLRAMPLLHRTSLLALLLVAARPAQAKQDHTNLDEDKVGAYALPPVLTGRDGKLVRTAAQWTKKRRPEILRLYEEHVHGHSPATLPRDLSFTVVEEDAHALGGTAHRKQIAVRFSGNPDAPVMHVLLYTPAAAHAPVPVFLCLHFNGNWAIVDDPGVRLHDTW